MEAKRLPDSKGWWWCREAEGYLPGDELCAEVTGVSDDGVLVRWGGECALVRPPRGLRPDTAFGWFWGMEWFKVESPWSTNEGEHSEHRAPPLREQADDNIWADYEGDPEMSQADWRLRVYDGDTTLGYWEWVEHQLEIANDDLPPALSVG